MSPITQPFPSPGVPMPSEIRVKCPHCGKENIVSYTESEMGFICSGCGQKVDGKKPGKQKPDPDNLPFVEKDE